MTAGSRFWDRHAEGYARRPVADQASYEYKLEKTRAYLRGDMDLLEFGCGTGTTALTHAPHVRHIRAIDISEGMLSIARRKAEAQGIENVSFENSAIEDIEDKAGHYDVIMGHSILHLLKDRHAAIGTSFELLRPGGFFITSTACLSGMSPILSLTLRAVLPLGHGLGLLPWVAFISADDLIVELEEAGFQIELQWQPTKDSSIFLIAQKPDRN